MTEAPGCSEHPHISGGDNGAALVPGTGPDRAWRELATRAVLGVAHTGGASAITLTLGLARAILLARFLRPAHFGVVAFALFFIGLGARLGDLGLDNALIHRQAAGDAFTRTYFTLRVGLDLAVAGALLAAAPYLQARFAHVGGLAAVMPFLVLAYALFNFSQVQETMFRKRLAFASLAKTDIAASAVMTVTAPYLAWRGYGYWALVAEQLSGAVARTVLTWGWFRCWRPQFGWSREAGAALWAYGRPNWLAANLLYALDRFDDFWIGFALGKSPLGYYSRSYEFAHYPRRVFANPLVAVCTPVFARLQHDRKQLSQAFFRASYTVIRAGFLVAGMLAVVMPEFIDFVIGAQWRPMLWTFRLMLVYAALDPLLLLLDRLFLATGQPQQLQRIRLLQAVFFLPGVVAGAELGGINGVALAADGMLLIGAAAAYRPLRSLADFSVAKLAAWPVLALAAAVSLQAFVEVHWHGGAAGGALLKVVVFASVFGGVLLVGERRDYLAGVRWAIAAARGRWAE